MSCIKVGCVKMSCIKVNYLSCFKVSLSKLDLSSEYQKVSVWQSFLVMVVSQEVGHG